jgi:AcrR family transcriptional regulator
MVEEGYAAVTARRLATVAGVTQQLVYYYFRTMDELLLALLARDAQKWRERQAAALSSEQPLWALWEFICEPPNSNLYMEFIALASHRKVFLKELARYGDAARVLQVTALSRTLTHYGRSRDTLPALTLTMLMGAISRMLITETRLGITRGHRQLRTLVTGYLKKIEGPRRVRTKMK